MPASSTSTSSTAIDIDLARRQRPGLADMTYLNTGTAGIVAEPVVDALLENTGFAERHAHRAYEPQKEKAEASRATLAAFLGADPGEIAFAVNATEAVNWVTASFRFQPGDEVLTSLSEHPSMNMPWSHQEARGGARLRWFELSHDPAETLRNLEDAITPQTRMIAISHVERHHGVRVPADEICALARAAGLLVFLDGAQSVGQFPVDLHAMEVDFYAANCHKWLCGPNGTGVFYCRQDRLHLLEQAHVGPGGQASWDRAGGLVLGDTASRFEYGTRSWGVAATIGDAVDAFQAIGPAAIELRIKSLAAYVRTCVADRGWQLTSPTNWEHGSALVSFVIPGVDGRELCHDLQESANTWLSSNTSNGFRFSAHYYNTEEEIDRAFQNIERLVPGG